MVEPSKKKPKAANQCWECRKRRLVCDKSLPVCKKCVRNGKECPGYGDKKPLQWVEPGKVSREHKKKDGHDSDTSASRIKGKRKPDSNFQTDGCLFSTFKVDLPDNYHTALSVRPGSPKHRKRKGISGDSAENIKSRQNSIGRRIQSNCLRSVPLSDVLPLSSLDQWDVQLYHFYADRTSLTLAGPQSLEVWQSHVYEDAKEHSFVLHTLLAMSALHASFVEPKRYDHFSSMASRHYERAVTKFRTNVKQVDSENGRAVALFSMCMCIFSLGIPSFRGFPAGSSPLSMMLDIVRNLRKAWAALGPERHKVKHDYLKSMMKPESQSPMHQLSDESRQLLHDLEEYIQVCGESEEDKQVYRHDMYLLVKSFWKLPHYAPFTDFLDWPMEFSDRFLEHMLARKPLPLFFLSYIMVPFYHSPNMWLIPWAKPIIEEIWWTLDPPLRRFIFWPAKYVGLIADGDHGPECRCFDCYMNEKAPGFHWKSNMTPLIAGKLSQF